jgi:hypothetical protein
MPFVGRNDIFFERRIVMKKLLLLVVLLVVVSTSVSVVAKDQKEHASDGVPFEEIRDALLNMQRQIGTGETCDSRIPIAKDDLPLTITESGSYYLTEDANCVSTAITVTTDNVTIDLMGYSLIGHGGEDTCGIYMDGRSNVEIRNGTVRDFNYGIYEISSIGQDHRIINVRAISNSQHGIYLSGKNYLVKDCTVSNNGYKATETVHGIFVGTGCTVTGNTAYANGYAADDNVYGIYAAYASTVAGNTACSNGYSATGHVHGIFVGTGCTVTGNTAYDNGYAADDNVYGIYAANGSTVVGNTARHNGYYGINVRGICVSFGCTVTSNTAHDNGLSAANAYGIFVGTGCTVTGNTAYDNGDAADDNVYGIYLAGNDLVDQNTAFNNGGINMNEPGDCTFGLNHAP